MAKKSRGPPGKGLWAYAYDVTFPDRDDGLQAIQNLLDQEHNEAREGRQTWAGRVVVEPPVTRILIISDSPEQDRTANRRIEAELILLNATFKVTAPLSVADDAFPRLVDGDPPPESF